MWDYLVERVRIDIDAEAESQTFLQARGGEGWELVLIEYLGSTPSSGPLNFRVVLKRRIERRSGFLDDRRHA